MTMANVQVRRATVDDLRQLEELWQKEQLPWKELEPRFKEFQVAVGDGGEVLAAIGLQIQNSEGLLHSEAFAHPEQSDALRDLIWDRLQMQARNHGLVRFWTQLATPFWHGQGLNLAEGEILAKLPAGFRGHPTLPWLYVQLRDDLPPMLSADQEFALFRDAERERTERVLRHARVLKMVAGVVSVIVFLLVLVWAFFWFRLQSQPGG